LQQQFCLPIVFQTDAVVFITYVGFFIVEEDNHVLIFYTVIYCHYAEHTDELQLDDLQVVAM
jgi:hypothetical protein